MDGWGGRRATWCHKAQLERACPGSVQTAGVTAPKVDCQACEPEPEPEPGRQGPGEGHAPRRAGTRPQGPEGGRRLCPGLGELLPGGREGFWGAERERQSPRPGRGRGSGGQQKAQPAGAVESAAHGGQRAGAQAHPGLQRGLQRAAPRAAARPGRQEALQDRHAAEGHPPHHGALPRAARQPRAPLALRAPGVLRPGRGRWGRGGRGLQPAAACAAARRALRALRAALRLVLPAHAPGTGQGGGRGAGRGPGLRGKLAPKSRGSLCLAAGPPTSEPRAGLPALLTRHREHRRPWRRADLGGANDPMTTEGKIIKSSWAKLNGLRPEGERRRFASGKELWSLGLHPLITPNPSQGWQLQKEQDPAGFLPLDLMNSSWKVTFASLCL